MPGSGVSQYRSVGMLGAQVERLLTIFPREQVHLIFFEDFVRRTGETYRETLRFLGVPDDGRTSFPASNAQKSHRFPWLFAPFSRRPVWVQRSLEKTKALLGPAAYSKLQKIYASPRKRNPFRNRSAAEWSPISGRTSNCFPGSRAGIFATGCGSPASRPSEDPWEKASRPPLTSAPGKSEPGDLRGALRLDGESLHRDFRKLLSLVHRPRHGLRHRHRDRRRRLVPAPL